MIMPKDLVPSECSIKKVGYMVGVGVGGGGGGGGGGEREEEDRAL